MKNYKTVRETHGFNRGMKGRQIYAHRKFREKRCMS